MHSLLSNLSISRNNLARDKNMRHQIGDKFYSHNVRYDLEIRQFIRRGCCLDRLGSCMQ